MRPLRVYVCTSSAGGGDSGLRTSLFALTVLSGRTEAVDWAAKFVSERVTDHGQVKLLFLFRPTLTANCVTGAIFLLGWKVGGFRPCALCKENGYRIRDVYADAKSV